jgi:hypothetical protein
MHGQCDQRSVVSSQSNAAVHDVSMASDAGDQRPGEAATELRKHCG